MPASISIISCATGSTWSDFVVRHKQVALAVGHVNEKSAKPAISSSTTRASCQALATMQIAFSFPHRAQIAKQRTGRVAKVVINE